MHVQAVNPAESLVTSSSRGRGKRGQLGFAGQAVVLWLAPLTASSALLTSPMRGLLFCEAPGDRCREVAAAAGKAPL